MNADLASLRRYRQHGDAFAFQELVEAHAGMVFATARRVTRDAARAQDVTQETFLELARNAARITRSVGAWLHRVAWRKARDVVRADVTRRRYEEAAGAQLYTARETTWEELEPLIDEAIEQLPENLREPLMQHFFCKRSQQELAAMLGVNQSTVSRLLDSGIAELRSRLRSKHVICGATLAALLSMNSTQAAPVSLTTSLGKLAISGTGTGASASPTPITTITTTLLAMSATKVLFATAAVAALLGAPFLFLAGGPGRTESTRTTATSPARKPGPAAATQPTLKAASHVGGPTHYRPPPVSAEVRRKVDAIIRRHQHMSTDELTQSPEMREIGKRFYTTLAALESNPEFVMNAQNEIKTIHAIKGAGPGKLEMQLDLGRPTGENLGEPLLRSWLEAIVSDDPGLVEDWVLNRLKGAIFEFGMDPGLERTSEGVSVPKKAPEAIAKPESEDTPPRR
jgi:RNA polymerase sigma factor (sigma-70 family)